MRSRNVVWISVLSKQWKKSDMLLGFWAFNVYMPFVCGTVLFFKSDFWNCMGICFVCAGSGMQLLCSMEKKSACCYDCRYLYGVELFDISSIYDCLSGYGVDLFPFIILSVGA